MEPEQKARIARELKLLASGGQKADLVDSNPAYVIYRDVPTSGTPATTDVIVVVPGGYPGTAPDNMGLPQGSALIPRVAGGGNVQGTPVADGVTWSLASYHPHQWPNNGWDQQKHGFHTYFDHVLSWLTALT